MLSACRCSRSGIYETAPWLKIIVGTGVRGANHVGRSDQVRGRRNTIVEPFGGDRARTGMRPSFEETFRGEYPALHRYLRRRVGMATADDLAASTFATAYENWAKLDPERAVRPWLYGIASHLLHRHWRTERRTLRAWTRTHVDPTAYEETDVAADRIDAAVRVSALVAALAALRPRDREVLLLSVWAELGDREIAEALGLPIGTVKSRLSRTKARLRRKVGENMSPDSRPALHQLTKEA